MDIPRYMQENHGITLSQQQRAAMEAVSGDVLLLAVPGAGKTTVLTARIANLLANHGADPRRILTLTFSREGARDMARRWERLFGGLFPRDPAFSTIHSFCLRLLEEYAAGRGSRLPELLEGGAQRGRKERLLGEVYREITGEYASDEVLSRAANAVGYCVNMRLTGREEGIPEGVPHLARLLERYTARKREEQLMDFDDMLLFAYTALERSPLLRERAAGRYDYILVDEAQDTSRLQHSILHRLERENLFMVGDEDQSIYGFRGAWPQGLLRFFEERPQGRLLKLEENYRSTGAVVCAASRLIAQNRQRYSKTVFTRRPEGEPVHILRELDHGEEYSRIAELLERVPPERTCAVLYRTGYTGIGLGWTLRRRGIPFFSRESRLGYRSDTITREVTNLLRLAQNPGDQEAFRRSWFLLPCRISKKAVERALAAQPRDLLREVLEEEFTGRNTGRIVWVQRVLARMAGQPPLRQLKTILEELEYLQVLDHRCQNNYDRGSYLQKLSVLRDFAKAAPDTAAFLESLQGAERVLDSPQRRNIILSSVHSAKGQEFDQVIIADAIEGVFPMADALSFHAAGDPRPLEEERRLFYTAMTRARERLTIFAPATCLGQSLLPARFLYSVSGADVPELDGVPLVPGLRVAHAFYGVGALERADPLRGEAVVYFLRQGKKKFTLEELRNPMVFRLY